MRVCYLGPDGGNIDEGMKVTLTNLRKEVERQGISTLTLEPTSCFKQEYWTRIRNFDPDIVHYVPGPSSKSLLLGRITKFVTGASLVQSTPLPMLGMVGRNLLTVLQPDCAVVQSEQTEQLFERKNVRTEFLPTGVDLEKYRPVTPEARRQVRDELEISEQATVVLHVGHIKRERNIGMFKQIQQADDIQTVLIGSSTTETDRTLKSELEEAGCTVIDRYIANIERYYGMSDVYMFPTVSKTNCIETPASVLEALACNVPVVTTRFGALPRLFDADCDGIVYTSEDDLIEAALHFAEQKSNYNTRELIENYSWPRIAESLVKIYKDVS